VRERFEVVGTNYPRLRRGALGMRERFEVGGTTEPIRTYDLASMPHP
jgi:hypothetical protein